MPMSLTSMCTIRTFFKLSFAGRFWVKVDGHKICNIKHTSFIFKRPTTFSETVYIRNKSEFQKNYLLIFFKTVHFQDRPVSMNHMIHRLWIFQSFSTAVFLKTSSMALKT